MKCTTLLLLLPGTLAFELPFKVSSLFSRSAVATEKAAEPPVIVTPKIAIIGAGAGGSSAAFWVSKAKERFGLDVDIDVYESSDYIGGRSTVVYPHNNKSLPELELGGSIFVGANKNLWRASEEFNLTRRGFGEENYETGIWDGENLIFSFSGGWWDTAKVLWRYGFMSPKRTEDYVRGMINRFLDFYTANSPKWDSISDLSATLGWTELTNSTTSEHLQTLGVSDRYVNEVVEAATRVNYGQDANYIHALEGACSMAASGAVGIAGGNFQLFEQFLNHSGANVYLKTPVKSITPGSPSKPWSIKSKRGTVDYKAVILAAPFHSTHITVPSSISEQVPEQPYVHLHVTLLATTSEYPNPAYFGLASGSKVPRMMLTTAHGATGSSSVPEFNSLSYHGVVQEGEWAVKIFSDHKISDEWLNNMFNGQVTWVFRKEWDAYPKLPATASFPPVKLDRGFYYVNSFEPFISTMETETISSRNVVDLLLNDEFNSSICGKTISATLEVEDEGVQKPLKTSSGTKSAAAGADFVFGFDC